MTWHTSVKSHRRQKMVLSCNKSDMLSLARFQSHPSSLLGATVSSSNFRASLMGSHITISITAKLSTEQAAVFGEGGGLFHTIPDTSCIVKPVRTQQMERHQKLCSTISSSFSTQSIAVQYLVDIKTIEYFEK